MFHTDNGATQNTFLQVKPSTDSLVTSPLPIKRAHLPNMYMSHSSLNSPDIDRLKLFHTTN